MAFYGTSSAVFSQYDVTTKTYKNGFILESVGTTVNPAFVEGSFYCDNRLGIHRKLFKNAAVDAEVNTIPIKAAEVLFGHEINAEEKTETAKTDDKANYVGYGFIGTDAIDSATDEHIACWIPMVIFEEGENAFSTTGENLTFTAQKLSGTAIGDSQKVWREKKIFSTEAEALTWLKTKANITE